MGNKLPFNNVEITDRVAARLVGGAVNDVDDGSAPLNVAQKIESQPLSHRRPWNEAGHVGNGICCLPRDDHT